MHVALGVDQVHVTEIAQGAEVGQGVISGISEAAAERSVYVQQIGGRTSGVRRVVETGRPLAIADARTSDELRRDYVERWNVASAVFSPVGWHGEVRLVAI